MESGDHVEYLTGHTCESQLGVFCLQDSQIRNLCQKLNRGPKGTYLTPWRPHLLCSLDLQAQVAWDGSISPLSVIYTLGKKGTISARAVLGFNWAISKGRLHVPAEIHLYFHSQALDLTVVVR